MHDHCLSNTNCTFCYNSNLTFNSFFSDYNHLKNNTSFQLNCLPHLVSFSTNDNVSLNSNLKIYYQNVRGIRTKLFDLRCSVPMFLSYDIIILTETWLSPDITDGELGFNSFKIFRLDRNPNNSFHSRGGGVLIAVNSEIISNPVFSINSNVEHLFALLSVHSSSILIGATYLPPSSPTTVIESHLSTIDHLLITLKPDVVFLLGDYNMPNVSWTSDEFGLSASGNLTTSSTLLVDAFSFFNFFQLNCVVNSSGNILDLVLSNSKDLSIENASSPLIKPDLYHPPLSILYHCPKIHKVDFTRSYFDFKAGDYPSISRFFNSYDWKSTFSLYPVNDAAIVFNDALLSSVEKFIPKKIFRTPKFPLWVSSTLKCLINQKKYAHKIFKLSNSASDYLLFSNLRAKCKRLSRTNYRSYICNTERFLSSNPSKFWKYTRDLKQHSFIPSSVHLFDEVSISPLSSANLFSKFFTSVFNQPSNHLSSDTSIRPLNAHPYNLPSNCHFSCSDVLSALESLKSNHSNGPDNISALLLYNCRNSLVYPLYLLFQRSLNEGVFPTIWKTCSITPILKSGDPSDVSNYRPISILPHIAKLFESLVYSSIKRSLNHIITDCQHGFRTGKSTVTSSLVFSTYILENIEAGSQVDTIFLDFKKAFDTVDHCTLINILDNLGIGNPLLSWLESYLTSRRQFVSLNGVHSDLCTIPSGVPQGGHLSPLLFIIFVNSLPDFLSSAKVLLFADDIKLFLKIASASDCLLLQADLDTFCIWAQKLNLTLNTEKCHVMSFSRNRSPISHSYSLIDTPVNRVTLIKDLGIYFSPTLSFEHHINYTIGRALKILGFIKRNTSNFSSISCLRALYFSLVRSILEYGVVVWHPYLARDTIRLERVQNRFLSYAAFLLKIAHPQHDYTIIRATLNIPLLSTRRAEADITFLTSLLNGFIVAPDLLSSISFRVPSQNIRNHSIFQLPLHHTSYGQNHPLHRMLGELNKVSPDTLFL